MKLKTSKRKKKGEWTVNVTMQVHAKTKVFIHNFKIRNSIKCVFEKFNAPNNHGEINFYHTSDSIQSNKWIN